MGVIPVPVPRSTEATTPFKASGQRFEARLLELEVAARGWAARPHSPEAHFISAMIGTMRGFADLAVESGLALQEIVERAEAGAHARLRLAEEEVARLKWTVSDSVEVLKKARAELGNVELDRKKLAQTAVSSLTSEIVTMLKPHFATRTVNINRDWMVRTWVIAGIVGLVVYLGGALTEAWLTWRP